MHSSLVIVLAAIATLSQALPSAYESQAAAAKNTNPDKRICAAANPAPAAAICSPGSLSKPAVLKNSRADSADYFEKCRDACESVTACKSFTFDPFATLCQFYSKPLSQMGYTAGSNGASYVYDRTCFKCQACKITLANGDFETGAIAPWSVSGDDGAFGSIVSPGEGTSSHALNVVVPVKGGQYTNGASIVQEFDQCIGKNYTLSFDFRVTNYASAVFVVLWTQIDDTSVPKTLYQSYNQPASNDWTHVSVTNVAKFNNYAALAFKIFGKDSNQATYQFDNISIVPTTA